MAVIVGAVPMTLHMPGEQARPSSIPYQSSKEVSPATNSWRISTNTEPTGGGADSGQPGAHGQRLEGPALAWNRSMAKREQLDPLGVVSEHKDHQSEQTRTATYTRAPGLTSGPATRPGLAELVVPGQDAGGVRRTAHDGVSPKPSPPVKPDARW